MIGARLLSKHWMNDRCMIGVHTVADATAMEETVTYPTGSEIKCRFIADKVAETGDEQIDMSEAEAHVPLGTTVTARDRIEITKLQRGNYRETLSPVLTFAIIGDPKQDETHIILKLKSVTGGSKL